MANRTPLPRLAMVGLVLVASATVCSSVSTGSAGRAPEHEAHPAASSSSLRGCRVFPRNNFWNTPVTDLAVSPRNAGWLRHMSPRSFLHPDFGKSYGEQPVPSGIPITVVTKEHAPVHVRFRSRRESDLVPYPLGNDTRIEGGRNSRGDRHAVVLDRSSCE